MIKVRKKIIGALAAVMAVSLAAGAALGFPAREIASAERDSDAWVPVGEIYNDDTANFNAAELRKLYQALAGEGVTTIVGLESAMDAKSGTLTSADFRKNNGGSNNVSVYFGGMKWDAVYLTKAKTTGGNTAADDIILDLWRSADELTSGDGDIAVYSDWGTNAIYTYSSNMYSTSRIRVETLNAGGKYSTSTSGDSTLATEHAQDENNQYARFTMSEADSNGKESLIKYLAKPSEVGYQAKEWDEATATSVNSGKYYFPNDAYEEPTGSGKWFGADYDYGASKDDGREEGAKYGSWKDDYLWLPSLTEVGTEDGNGNGIWDTDVSLRSAIRETYNYYWLRSGAHDRPGQAYVVYDGGTCDSQSVHNPAKVRPALHLNLTAAARTALPMKDDWKDDTKRYAPNGVKWVLENTENVTIAPVEQDGGDTGWYDAENHTITADKVGEYKLKVKPTEGFQWAGGGNEEIIVTYTVVPDDMIVDFNGDKLLKRQDIVYSSGMAPIALKLPDPTDKKFPISWDGVEWSADNKGKIKIQYIVTTHEEKDHDQTAIDNYLDDLKDGQYSTEWKDYENLEPKTAKEPMGYVVYFKAEDTEGNHNPCYDYFGIHIADEALKITLTEQARKEFERGVEYGDVAHTKDSFETSIIGGIDKIMATAADPEKPDIDRTQEFIKNIDNFTFYLRKDNSPNLDNGDVYTVDDDGIHRHKSNSSVKVDNLPLGTYHLYVDYTSPPDGEDASKYITFTWPNGRPSFTVSARKIKVTLTFTAQTYGKEPTDWVSVSAVRANGEGNWYANSDAVNADDFHVLNLSYTLSGSGTDAAPSSSTLAGTYTVVPKYENANYEVEFAGAEGGATFTYTVNKREITVAEAASIAWINADTRIYSGSTVTPTARLTVDGKRLTLSVKIEGENGNNTFRNVDAYTFTADLSAADKQNYTFAEGAALTHTAKINPATLSLAWEDKSFTYTGDVIGEEDYPTVTVSGRKGGDDDSVVDVKLAPNREFKNAGEYTFTATLQGTGAGNYIIDEGGDTHNDTHSYTIQQAEITAADVGYKGETHSYVGAEQEAVLGSITGKKETLEKGTDYKLQYKLTSASAASDDRPRNVGTYYVYVVFLGDAANNYLEIKDSVGTFQITKVKLSDVTVTGSPIYDGSVHEPEITVKGVGTDGELKQGAANGYTVTYTTAEGTDPGQLSNGKPMGAGTYTVAFALHGDALTNYEQPENGTFTIQKATISADFSAWSDETTYTGDDFAPALTAAVEKTVKTNTAAVPVRTTDYVIKINGNESAAATNAGEYTVSIELTAAGAKNYTWAGTTHTYRVTPAPVTAKWIDDSKEYYASGENLFEEIKENIQVTKADGTPFTNYTVAVNGGTIVAAGGYTLIIAVTDENYAFDDGATGYETTTEMPVTVKAAAAWVKIGEKTTGYGSIGTAWTAAKGKSGAVITLQTDVETAATLEADGSDDITLDLNGKTLKMTGTGSVLSISAGKVTLKDSAPGAENRTAISDPAGSGSLTVTGGLITGGNATDGGGVSVAGGTFVMEGGTIAGNTADTNGGGVYLSGKGTFTMASGTIAGNSAVRGGGVYKGGKDGAFTMNGGAIRNNKATENGGGVEFNNGTFAMTNGTISGNKAQEGAGVYAENTDAVCAFTMSGVAQITNNAAEKNGGGVYVSKTGHFSMTGGSVTGNTANENGPDVYMHSKGTEDTATFTWGGGKIGTVYLGTGTFIEVQTGFAALASGEEIAIQVDGFTVDGMKVLSWTGNSPFENFKSADENACYFTNGNEARIGKHNLVFEGEPEWSDDKGKATFNNIHCAHDGCGESTSVTVETTSSSLENETCTEQSGTTYTATVTLSKLEPKFTDTYAEIGTFDGTITKTTTQAGGEKSEPSHTWKYTWDSNSNTLKAECTNPLHDTEKDGDQTFTVTFAVPQSAIYNGKNQPVTADGDTGVFPGGYTVTYQYNKNTDGNYGELSGEPKNAGYYQVTVTYGEGSSRATGTMTFQIRRKELTVTWTKPSKLIYGEIVGEFKAEIAGIENDDEVTAKLTYSGKPNSGSLFSGDATAPTLAGEYTVTVTLDGAAKDNYILKKDDGSEAEEIAEPFTIARAELAGNINWSDAEDHDYDGKEHDPKATIEGVNGTLTLEVAIAGENGNKTLKNADTYTLTATLNEADAGNYTLEGVSNKEKTVEIAKAKIATTDITWEKRDEYVYQGSPFDEMKANVDAKDGDGDENGKVWLTIEMTERPDGAAKDEFRNAGSYVFTASIPTEYQNNYEWTGEATLTVEVKKKTIESITWQDEKSFPYEGSPLATPKAMFEGAGTDGKEIELFVTPSFDGEFQNARKYTFKAALKSEHEKNYELKKDMALTQEFEITPVDMKLEFDGEKLPKQRNVVFHSQMEAIELKLPDPTDPEFPIAWVGLTWNAENKNKIKLQYIVIAHAETEHSDSAVTEYFDRLKEEEKKSEHTSLWNEWKDYDDLEEALKTAKDPMGYCVYFRAVDLDGNHNVLINYFIVHIAHEELHLTLSEDARRGFEQPVEYGFVTHDRSTFETSILAGIEKITANGNDTNLKDQFVTNLKNFTFYLRRNNTTVDGKIQDNGDVYTVDADGIHLHKESSEKVENLPVGIYHLYVVYRGDVNGEGTKHIAFTWEGGRPSFEVKKREITITLTFSAKTYGEDPAGWVSVSASRADGKDWFAPGDKTEGDEFKVLNLTYTLKTTEKAPDAKTPANESGYEVVAKWNNDNYEVTFAYGDGGNKYIVEKAELAKPAADSAEVSGAYNGTNYEIEISGYDDATMGASVPDGAVFASSTDGKYKFTATNAGEYTLTIKLKDQANYKWKEGEADAAFTIRISKAKNGWQEGHDLALEGWTYGEEASSPSATPKFGAEREITFTYTHDDNRSGQYFSDPPTDAGTYWVKAHIDGTDNYDAFEESISFTISKRTISVDEGKVSVGEKTYDGKTTVEAGLVKFDGAVSGILGKDEGSVSVSVRGAELSDKNANDAASVTITFEITGDAGNYQFGSDGATTKTVAKTMKVAKAKLTVSVTGNPTYNGKEQEPAITVTGVEADGTLTQGAANGYTVTYTTAEGTDPGQLSNGKPMGAGTYTVAFALSGDAATNYEKPKDESFEIGKAKLTVRAKDKTITYGDDPASAPEDVTITGFVNDERLEDVVTGAAEFEYDYRQYDDVGEGRFEITLAQGTLSAQNYEFEFVNGTLTVKKKTVTATVEPNKGFTYGDKIVLGDFDVTFEGVEAVDKDYVTAELTFGGEANDGTAASGSTPPQLAGKNYTVRVSGLGGTKAANYELDAAGSLAAEFSVAKKSVAAPESFGSKTYNGKTQTADVDDAGKEYTVEKNEGGIQVGKYDVVLKLKDENNYKWEDEEGATESSPKELRESFEITKATLTVEFSELEGEKTYDGTTNWVQRILDAVKKSISSNTGADLAAGTDYVVTITKDEGENLYGKECKDAGTYSVTVEIAPGAAGNYNELAGTHSKTYVIAKAELTIAWQGSEAEYSYVYGTTAGVNPKAPTANFKGDDAKTITINVTESDNKEFKNAGKYRYTATLHGDAAENYDVTNPTQEYTIEKAELTASLSARVEYGDALEMDDLTISVTDSDLKNGDEKAAIESQIRGKVQANEFTGYGVGTAAGTRGVKLNHKAVELDNYTVTFSEGTVEIAKRKIRVTLGGVETDHVYGDEGHGLTVAATRNGSSDWYYDAGEEELLGKELAIKFTKKAGGAAQEYSSALGAGTYTLSVEWSGESTLKTNYDFTLDPAGEYVVEKMSVSVEWKDWEGHSSYVYQGKAYTEDQYPTATAKGAKSADGNATLTLTVSLQGADPFRDVKEGGYTFLAALSEDDAHNYNLTGETKTYEIVKAELTVTWSGAAEEYRYEYTGGELHPEASAEGLNEDGSISFTVEPKFSGKAVGAGKYRYGVSFPSEKSGLADNYELNPATVEYEICKAENGWKSGPSLNGLAWNDDMKWTYDGEAHVAEATPFFGADSLKFTYSEKRDSGFVDEQPTDANTYYVKVTVTGTDDYDGMEEIKKFVIERWKIESVTWIGEAGDYTYTGSEFEKLTATAAGVAADGGTLDLDVAMKTEIVGAGDSFKLAGDYVFTATLPARYEKNYSFEAENAVKPITILKRAVAVVWDSRTFTYRGSAFEESEYPTATADGVEGEENLKLIVSVFEYAGSDKSFMNAGKYVFQAVLDESDARNANYRLDDSRTHDYTVSPAEMTAKFHDDEHPERLDQLRETVFRSGHEHAVDLQIPNDDDERYFIFRKGTDTKVTGLTVKYIVTTHPEGPHETDPAKMLEDLKKTGVWKDFADLEIQTADAPMGYTVYFMATDPSGNHSVLYGWYGVHVAQERLTIELKEDSGLLSHFEYGDVDLTEALLEAGLEQAIQSVTSMENGEPVDRTKEFEGKFSNFSFYLRTKANGTGDLYSIQSDGVHVGKDTSSPVHLPVGTYYLYVVYVEKGEETASKHIVFQWAGDRPSFSVTPRRLSVELTFEPHAYGDDFSDWVKAGVPARAGGKAGEWYASGEENVDLEFAFALETVGTPSATTNAGTYNVIASYKTGNYEVTFVNAAGGALAYTIEKATVARPDRCAHSFVYDGTEQTYEVAPNDLYEVTGNVRKNAGTYAVKISLRDRNNYKWAGTDGSDDLSYEFVIQRAKLTVKASDREIVYGDAAPVGGVTYDGFANGETPEDAIRGTVTFDYDGYEAFKDVGDYRITPGGLSADNYDVEYEHGTLTVKPKEIEVEWGEKHYTYTGSAFSDLPAATAEGIGDDGTFTLSVALDDPAQTFRNAGDYRFKATLDGANAKAKNYILKRDTAVYTVAKQTVTAPKIQSKIYNGAMQTADVQTSALYRVSENNGGIKAGNYDVKLTLTDAANYRWAESDTPDLVLVFTITEIVRDLSEIGFEDVTVKYDGEAHSIYIEGTLPSGVTVAYENNGQIEPNLYTVTAVFSDPDGEFARKTATLTILRMQVQADEVVLDSEDGFNPSVSVVVERSGDVTRGFWAWEKDEVSEKYVVKAYKDGEEVSVDGKVTVRLLIPEELREKDFRLVAMARGENVEYTRDGDYVVFEADGLTAYAFMSAYTPYFPILIAATSVLFANVLVLIVLAVVVKKKRNTKAR